MAERTNPFGLDVDLDMDQSAILVKVMKKDDDGNREAVDQNTFPLSSVHENLQLKVGLYGYSKILQDRTSDVKAGPDKLAAMSEVALRLSEGQWEKEREAGGPTVSAEVEALAELKSVSVADIQRALRRYTPEQKDQILKSDAVQKLATAIRAKREEAEEVDFDNFLASDAAD